MVTSRPPDPSPRALRSTFGSDAGHRGFAARPARLARVLDRSLVAALRRACRRCVIRQGSRWEAQESNERRGPATDRRRHGFPSGARPRSCNGASRRTAGGQRIAVTRSRLLGRGTLWRAGIGEDARTSSQACGHRARKPDEPQGWLWDATSPRIGWRRNPSRPGGTARTERARSLAATCRSGREPVGVDSSRCRRRGDL